jgi:2-oxoglutarate ferredoxin oxidoreductase subunit beta
MTVTEQTIHPAADIHPIDNLLRADRLPHILCPGCGIGTVIHGYAHAIAASGITCAFPVSAAAAGQRAT